MDKLSFKCANFQDEDCRIDPEFPLKRRMDHFNGSDGCIFHSSQKYLCFQTKEGVFQFKALPFRIATARLEFTRIVKEVKIMAMTKDIRIHQYLDDWLLCSNSQAQGIKDAQYNTLVPELGWLKKYQKIRTNTNLIYPKV